MVERVMPAACAKCWHNLKIQIRDGHCRVAAAAAAAALSGDAKLVLWT
jgi:hypothetical protein